MSSAGMVNVGQLVRERHADEGVVAVGFGTHRGSVIAADRWGGAVRGLPVPPAAAGSTEALLHRAAPDADSLFVFSGTDPAWADERRDHRAIGVVYHPDVERAGNYVPTVLGRRYDAFVFGDHSTALTPLHRVEPPAVEPDTFPTGH